MPEETIMRDTLIPTFNRNPGQCRRIRWLALEHASTYDGLMSRDVREDPLVKQCACETRRRMTGLLGRLVSVVASLLAAVVLVIGVGWAVQATAPAPTRTSQVTSPQNPEFLKAADEVLQQMSVILHLPIKQPLKKSLRSKQEIRAYLRS